MTVENGATLVGIIQIGIPVIFTVISVIYVKLIKNIFRIKPEAKILSSTDKMKFVILIGWLIVQHLSTQAIFVSPEIYLSDKMMPFWYISLVSIVVITYLVSIGTIRIASITDD